MVWKMVIGLDFIVVGFEGEGATPVDPKVFFLAPPPPMLTLLLLLPLPVPLFLLPKVKPPGLVMVLLNWNCNQE